MYNYTLSLVMGLIALGFIVVSYFLSKKMYLLFQLTGIVFLILSYLFVELYFATVGLSVGFIRSLVCYIYERKNKKAPVFVPIAISVATVLAFVIVNIVILKDYSPYDAIYMAVLVMYAFVFTIRNVVVMRNVALVPAVLAVLYNVLAGATLFVIISCSFELLADIVAIGKYYLFDRKNLSEK